MSSEAAATSTDGTRVPDVPPPARPVARLMTVGVVLLIVGFLTLAAAIHESLYVAVIGFTPSCDANGNCDWGSSAGPLTWLAVLTIAAATWLVAASVHELARRSDTAVGAVRSAS